MDGLIDTVDAPEHLDLIVVGAGVAGINCAYRLQTELPHMKFVVFEGRDGIGGTWDLFRFPGIRSDTDMYAYSFPWCPWPHQNPIVEGPLILEYLRSCVSQYKLDRYIRLRHKVLSMNWSSKTQQWTASVGYDGVLKKYTSRFVALGTGYFDHDTPRQTTIPGISNFTGKVIHPQFWPEDFDYSGQKIAIIGSGTTTVTLLPNLVKKAAKVTVVQRSPSYIMSTKNSDPSPLWMRNYQRVWYVLMGYLLLLFCDYFPGYMRKVLRKRATAQLPDSISVDPHFSPRYNPWEERLCFSPDGDFYEALHRPEAGIVTGSIKRVTEQAVEMEDGHVVDADVIVTATGLTWRPGGKIDIRVDGEVMKWDKRLTWNHVMLQDVPNLFYFMGHARSSAWTVGVDNNTRTLIRFLKLMEQRRALAATPRVPWGMSVSPESFWPLYSTYSQEAQDRLPIYGTSGPWRPRNSIFTDFVLARWGDIKSDIQFSA